MDKQDSRAVALAASNMGSSLSDAYSAEAVEALMIQGLREGYCGQDRDDGVFQVMPDCGGDAFNEWSRDADKWAYDSWYAELAEWKRIVAQYDGQPLPEYWADIDKAVEMWASR